MRRLASDRKAGSPAAAKRVVVAPRSRK